VKFILIQLLVEGARFSVLGMAVALSLSVSRHLDLTLGVPALIGAYLVASARGTPDPAHLIVAAAITGLAGILVGASLFRHDGSERFSGTARLLLSLSLLLLFENVISLFVGDEALLAPDLPARFQNGIFGLSERRATVFAVAAVAWLVTAGLVRYSSLGRHLRAVRSDPVLALAVGLPVRRTSVLAFGLAFLLAGLGGVLTYMDTAITPGFAFPYLLMAIVAAVVGGSSSITGAIAGAFVVSGLRSLATWHLGAEWSDSTAFFVLVAVALASNRHGRIRTQVISWLRPAWLRAGTGTR
jgi:branched-subunit amino acid ABC-type transport system permease component